MKKGIALALVAVMLLCLFAGCKTEGTPSAAPTPTGSKATPTPSLAASPEDEAYIPTLPIVDTPEKYTWWFPWSAMLAGMMTTLADNMGAQQIAKDTGITIEYIHPAIGQEAESFGILMASQSYTDFVHIPEGGTITYPGGVEKAIDDDVFIRLNELVDKYAPDYLTVVNRDPDKRIQTITDNGVRYGFHHLTEDAEPGWTGLAVRQDWLDTAGLELPYTIASWENMLNVFKSDFGATMPLMLPSTGVYYSSEFLSAYGIGKDFYNLDGTVKYGPLQDEYYDYIQLMADWYKKGLIDRDFMTRDGAGSVALSIPNELVLNEYTGAGPLVRGMLGPGYKNYGMVEVDDPIYFVAVVAPVINEGDVTRMGYVSQKVRSYSVITTACKSPETAVKYFNYLYTEQGSMAINWGIEGESFEIVGGKAQFTDNMFDYTTDKGTGIRYFWFRGDGPGLVDYNRMYHAGNMTEKNISLTWDENNKDYVMPVTSFQSEEGNEYSRLMADINVFVQERTVGFITGDTALSQSAFEAFRSQLKTMKIDDAINIQQAALDRYFSR